MKEHPFFSLQVSSENLKLSDFLVVPDNDMLGEVFGGKTVKKDVFWMF